ncbi:sulfatase [Nocardioides ungokensis]
MSGDTMTRRHHGALAALTLSLILLAVTMLSCLPAERRATPPRPPAEATTTKAVHHQRPNIILITTDDQNPDELRWMPRTRRELAGHGLVFTRALSPDPLCCPARAEIITGQLGQNNGVSSNLGLHGGFAALRQKQNTLAVWLRRVGYRTALVGKYLNGYHGQGGRQHGWTRWNPSVGDIYSYTHTEFYRDGSPRTVHRNVTPVVAHFAQQYVRDLSATGKPFFIWASFLPPHQRRTHPGGAELPPLPTRRHRHVLEHVRAPFLSKPTFGTTQGLQPEPWRTQPSVSSTAMQALFTRRIQSLQDVDAAVARLIATLRHVHQLRHTYVFFASDNGVLLGEHRLRGKDVLFQEALRVPLVVRVPGAHRGRSSRLPVTLADLAPTILALAGATPGRRQDGRSFAGVLHGRRVPWRDTQLIQTGRHASPGDRAAWALRGVWTTRYTYFRRVADGTSFLYDRRVDPFEATDVALDPRYHRTLAALRHRTDVLVHCAGASCNRRFGPVPPPRPR